jgi:signal transduction histidine kinase
VLTRSTEEAVRERSLQIGGSIWLDSRPGEGTTVYFTVVDPPMARE